MKFSTRTLFIITLIPCTALLFSSCQNVPGGNEVFEESSKKEEVDPRENEAYSYLKQNKLLRDPETFEFQKEDGKRFRYRFFADYELASKSKDLQYRLYCFSSPYGLANLDTTNIVEIYSSSPVDTNKLVDILAAFANGSKSVQGGFDGQLLIFEKTYQQLLEVQLFQNGQLVANGPHRFEVEGRQSSDHRPLESRDYYEGEVCIDWYIVTYDLLTGQFVSEQYLYTDCFDGGTDGGGIGSNTGTAPAGVPASCNWNYSLGWGTVGPDLFDIVVGMILYDIPLPSICQYTGKTNWQGGTTFGTNIQQTGDCGCLDLIQEYSHAFYYDHLQEVRSTFQFTSKNICKLTGVIGVGYGGSSAEVSFIAHSGMSQAFDQTFHEFINSGYECCSELPGCDG